jgi:hypothetical protein
MSEDLLREEQIGEEDAGPCSAGIDGELLMTAKMEVL